MKRTYDDYVEEYLLLCSRLCKTPADYTAEKVKVHNRAMKSLSSLSDEIVADSEVAESVFAVLLRCDDENVKKTAATTCLHIGVQTEEAVRVLETICQSCNRMAAMGAERVLKIWRGEIAANQPY